MSIECYDCGSPLPVDCDCPLNHLCEGCAAAYHVCQNTREGWKWVKP